MHSHAKDTVATVIPALRYRNALAMIEWLCKAFGFEKHAVYADGDTVHHAQLSWQPGGGVMLGSVKDTPDDPWPIPPGTGGAYVVTEGTDDIDAIHKRATAAGAQVLTKPHHTDYGSYDFALRDPEGNRWSFGTYRGEPR